MVYRGRETHGGGGEAEGIHVDIVLSFLIRYEYLAMLGILVLCGIGLPLPEEVTLLGSGLLVGWHEADFWLASLVCSVGIVMGDSIIFGLGHHFGQRFLRAGPMQLLLPIQRQARVQHFFSRHGAKALFLARFFPGVRIGVYAYAGSQRIGWARFIALDGLGVLISCPTSILVGRWAGRAFADDRAEAIRVASEAMHRLSHWIVLFVALAVALVVVVQVAMRRLNGTNS
jgi:membrane protein DedA with SNARE-associated domain